MPKSQRRKKFARLKLGQLRLRSPTGANDKFLLAATAHNLQKIALSGKIGEISVAEIYSTGKTESD